MGGPLSSNQVPWAAMLGSLLISDLVGSTRLRMAVGEASANALSFRIDALHDETIAADGGTVVRHTGDGAIAVLPRPSRAVFAALGLVEGLERMKVRGPVPELRIVVDVGDLEWCASDVRGLVFDRAFGLISGWDGAGIACTGPVADLAVYTEGVVWLPGPLPATLTPRRPRSVALRS